MYTRRQLLKPYDEGRIISKKSNQLTKIIPYLHLKTNPSNIISILRRKCKNITEAHITHIQVIMEVLEDIYPNLWDITLEYKVIWEEVRNYPYYATLWEDPLNNIRPLSFGDQNEEKCQQYRDAGYVQVEYDIIDNKPRLAFYNPRIVYRELSGEIYRKYEGVEVVGINFIVKFPFTTITNSKGMKLDLKDIFLSTYFAIRDDGILKIDNRVGIRTTITPIEYEKEYIHSHISKIKKHGEGITYPKSGPITNWSNVCLGHSDLGSLVLTYMTTTPNRDLITSLFMQYTHFLMWESLEGGPYNTIEAVLLGEENNSTIPKGNCHSICMDIIHRVIIAERNKADIGVNFEWKFSDGSFRIVDDDRFNTFLMNNYSFPTSYLMYKGENGKYYKEDNREIQNLADIECWLPFRGEKIFFKLEGEINIRGERPLYVHSNVRDYVRNYLEQRANYAYIKQTRITAISEGSDN